MSRSIFLQSNLQRVITAINTQNNLSLTVSNCIVSKPAPVSGSWREQTTTKNTVVKVSQTVPAVTYNGKNWVTYDRRDISTFLKLLPNSDKLAVDHPTKMSDLIRAINRRWGYGIELTDVIDEPIVLDGDGKATVVMVMHPESLLWIGSHTFNILPGDAMLNENVTTVALSGMNYPDGTNTVADASKGYAQPYSYQFDFTLRSTELHNVKVGTDLTGLVEALTYITGTTWVNTGADANNTYTLDGAEVTYAGLNTSDRPTSSAFKYLVVLKMGAKSKLSGNMYIQYNDKDDSTSPN